MTRLRSFLAKQGVVGIVGFALAAGIVLFCARGWLG